MPQHYKSDIASYTRSAFASAMQSKTVRVGFADSPVGSLCLAMIDGHIAKLSFASQKDQASCIADIQAFVAPATIERDDAMAEKFVSEYFTQKKRDFPLILVGTEFQIKVWKHLLSVSDGEIISYAGLGNMAGYPKAARAVGQAMNKNNIALVVPCHRVLASGGKIGGYAGGTSLKEQLLHDERMCG